MSSDPPKSLLSVPLEIVERIALFATAEPFLGPPSAVVPLLLTCRSINAALSINANTHLYAKVFSDKFDCVSAVRRFGVRRAPDAGAMASELQHRCIILKRLRLRLDARFPFDPTPTAQAGDSLRAVLWSSYLMMLENDGKNERQLRDYAGIEGWLNLFWFDHRGASIARGAIKLDCWPQNDERNALAMWLFWFLLRPGDYSKNYQAYWDATGVLKVLALAAHQYDLTLPSWTQFTPILAAENIKPVPYYGKSRRLAPPPLATPAVLSFLTLYHAMHGSGLFQAHTSPLNLSAPVSMFTRGSHEWDCEWERCQSLGRPLYDRLLTRSFRPGSIEGMWEGIFTYTEFTAYAALLSGAPPRTLKNCLVVQHHQMWKLREHHLLESNGASLLGLEPEVEHPGPLPAGNVLRSYFPAGTTVKENATGLQVLQPGKNEPFHYRRADMRLPPARASEGDSERPSVLDIIITGEGHSAWGQFSLQGRVRPCDGFITLSKEYSGGDRGVWLYRGYLVGDVYGHFAGRWRDTLSPPDVSGYEGCFMMSRRR